MPAPRDGRHKAGVPSGVVAAGADTTRYLTYVTRRGGNDADLRNGPGRRTRPKAADACEVTATGRTADARGREHLRAEGVEAAGALRRRLTAQDAGTHPSRQVARRAAGPAREAGAAGRREDANVNDGAERQEAFRAP